MLRVRRTRARCPAMRPGRRTALAIGNDSGCARKRVDRRREHPADGGGDECKRADSHDDREDAVHA